MNQFFRGGRGGWFIERVMRLVGSAQRGRNSKNATSATANANRPPPMNNSFLKTVSALSAGAATAFAGIGATFVGTAAAATELVGATTASAGMLVAAVGNAFVGGQGVTVGAGFISVAGGVLISTGGAIGGGGGATGVCTGGFVGGGTTTGGTGSGGGGLTLPLATMLDATEIFAGAVLVSSACAGGKLVLTVLPTMISGGKVASGAGAATGGTGLISATGDGGKAGNPVGSGGKPIVPPTS